VAYRDLSLLREIDILNNKVSVEKEKVRKLRYELSIAIKKLAVLGEVELPTIEELEELRGIK